MTNHNNLVQILDMSYDSNCRFYNSKPSNKQTTIKTLTNRMFQPHLDMSCVLNTNSKSNAKIMRSKWSQTIYALRKHRNCIQMWWNWNNIMLHKNNVILIKKTGWILANNTQESSIMICRTVSMDSLNIFTKSRFIGFFHLLKLSAVGSASLFLDF